MERVKTVAAIGNYLPRMCGIATFTTDLLTSLKSADQTLDCFAVAMNDKQEGYRYPNEVRFEINQNKVDEYQLAGEYLNINQVEVVSLQHEYGIFGGDTGQYILQLLRNLRMPVVTTLHTVLNMPGNSQLKVLKEIVQLSSKVVVMAERAKDFLTDKYGVPEEKIVLIHHGIPDMPFVDPNFYKDQFGVEGKRVVLTFGLLSPNKGIEYMIRALPAIVKNVPDVVYIVLGATHPHVKRQQGEEYRQSLERLARSLDVEENIMFFNRFVDLKELCEFLGAADLYVTPYLAEAQIVSGTLAYAMGVGKATISTPYWYAQEMISDDRGILVDFEDADSLAGAVIRLFKNELERNSIRKKAYTASRKAVWSQVALDYISLFNEIKAERESTPRPKYRIRTLEKEKTSLPDIKLDHLLTLTDDTGILQHATYNVPDREHGYCIDDNTRALIFTVMASPLSDNQTGLLDLQNRYLSFIKHAYNNENGWFRNFMSFDRKWLEEKGSQDSHSRTLWGLGVCCALSKDENCVAVSSQLFHKGLNVTEGISHPRALAFTLVGIHAYLAKFSGDSEVRRYRRSIAHKLYSQFEINNDRQWPWHNELVTYANAKIPQALLLSGQWLGNSGMLEKGFELLDWLIELQIKGDRFSPIGNHGWLRKGNIKASFDQQPIEAQAMVETCLLAFRMSAKEQYLSTAKFSFNWFMGFNDLEVVLYDYKTGGCRDGLTPDGANRNQGAESTLAWLLSLVSMHAFQAEQDKVQYVETIQE